MQFARSWQRNGRPTTADPIVRQQLAQAVIECDVMKYTADRSLTKTLRGGAPGPEGSMEKLFWSEMYQRMLENAVHLAGPFGQLLEGSPYAPMVGIWPYLMMYSKGRTIAAGTSEIQRNIIAKRVLGLPRGK